jgi:hypothetical protein
VKLEEGQSKVSSAWRMAAAALSIRIEAPYPLEGADGREILCIAFLPDFGSPKGMVIGLACRPNYKIDGTLKLSAETRGLFYSFINPDIYEQYNDEVFKEALVDWGYFGNENIRPSWLEAGK